MPSTYRLPEELGGAEVEVLHGFAREDGRVDAKLPSGTIITLSHHWLTPVPPPLPEEPPVGSVVLDDKGRAWQRIDTFLNGRGDWCCTVDDLGAEWDELCAVPLTRLVPAADPVSLPEVDLDAAKDGARVLIEAELVQTSRGWRVRTIRPKDFGQVSYLDHDEVNMYAFPVAALVAAADEAEAAAK